MKLGTRTGVPNFMTTEAYIKQKMLYKDSGANTRLKSLRISRNYKLQDVAKTVGLTPEWYYDIENYPEDIYTSLDLMHLFRICRLFTIVPSYLFTFDDFHDFYSLRDLIKDLQRVKEQLNKSDEDFDQYVGWGISDVFGDQQVVLHWNIDTARAIAQVIDKNWLLILDGIYEAFAAA